MPEQKKTVIFLKYFSLFRYRRPNNTINRCWDPSRIVDLGWSFNLSYITSSIRAIGCSFRPGKGTILIFYDSRVPVHTGSRLTDPGYSVPGEIHGFPAKRDFLQFFIIFGFFWKLVKNRFLGVPGGPWGPREPMGNNGNQGERFKSKKQVLAPELGSRFFKNFENVGLLWAPWGGPVTLGSPGGNLCWTKIWPKPPKGAGSR